MARPMPIHSCVAKPRKGQQRRRPSTVPTLIHVSPGCFSADLLATPTCAASPHNSGHATSSALRSPVSMGSGMMPPVGSAGKASCAVADNGANALSSFLSRAQQLESKLLQQRTAALARNISKVLDEFEHLGSTCKDASCELTCQKHDCDRAPISSDACYVMPKGRNHVGFWCKGCTVVQLVHNTGQ